MNPQDGSSVHVGIRRSKPSDPSPFPQFLEYVCLPGNIVIIEKECSESKRKSSQSLKSFISVVFPEHSSGLRNKTTSHTALRYILLKELTNENFPVDKGSVSACVFRMMEDVSKLIRAHYHSTPMTERQAYSDIRTRVIKPNFGTKFVEDLKSSLKFSQSADKKAMAVKIQTDARDERIMNQTDIDTTAALDIGRSLSSVSRRIMTDLNNESGETDEYRLGVLLAAVMFSTGCRLVEALLVSDFLFDSPLIGSHIRPGGQFVSISPVAKLRSGSVEKSSSRVILFGLTSDEVIDMVEMIRNLSRRINPVFSKLDKNDAGDRRYVVRMNTGYTTYVHHLLSKLNVDHNFTPRDFRGLYVAMSYKMWAKHPTSEIMWINKTLSHGSIDTSLSYNKFRLIEIITKPNTEYIRLRDTYESRLKAVEDLLAKIRNEVPQTDQEEEMGF